MKNVRFLIVVAVIVIFFIPSFLKIRDLKLKNRLYEGRIKGLIENNKKLIEERHRLEEDPVYLEKVAREKMGVARKGEVIFRLKPSTNAEKKTVAGFGVE